MYAEVIIPLALPRNYTWRVPVSAEQSLRPGCRVEVALRNKKYAGIVKRLHEEKPAAFEPKDLLSILDSDPLIHPEQAKLWDWMSQYYLCTEGEVMAAALPSHFKLSSESILVFLEGYGADFSGLDEDEATVAETLLDKKEMALTAVQQLLEDTRVYPVVKRLIDKGVCFVWEALKDFYKPRKETFILLHPDYTAEENLARLLNEDKKLQRAEKQLELLLAYLHLHRIEPNVTKGDLLKKSGATDAQLKGLMAKNILIGEQRNIDRLPAMPRQVNIDFELSPAQEAAYATISRQFETKSVCLLHGVTSSGKTQLYIRQIEEALQQNKQVLYLVPEIALTSQIVRRLQKHFGGYLGVYHSRFNQQERFEIWNKVRTGELKLLLGARSALFLPFQSLGLIIVDEEHDPSYKQQDPSPRYHARDAAIYYASLFKAKVLLGTATPSVESYFNARQGKYGLAELMERYGSARLPQIELVDTKKMLTKERAKVILSPVLEEAIREVLQAGKQVILFRNRRGYSPYQVCEICGWIPQCKNCDVSLTFHKLTNLLQCHYCGSTYPPVTTCAACGHHRFLQHNFGTEKIEEELGLYFPEAKIARMDVDSVRGKSGHDNLIRLFEQQRVDILVGTQMVVKGLDFQQVTLVGILDADSLLNFADFRVNERAFQLMEQVSGRAGRKDHEGRVLIQVANTNHPVLKFVQAHDFVHFFEHEIVSRKDFSYPPFTRMIRLVFRHKVREVVHEAAALFALSIRKELGQYVTGPAEPAIARIRNQYLMEILLKLPKDAHTIHVAKTVIQQQRTILLNDKKFRTVVVVPDIDPV